MNRESKSQLIPKKHVDSPFLNFFSLIAGLVIAITLLLMLIDQFRDPSAKLENSKTTGQGSILATPPGAPPQTLEDSSAEELNQMLVASNNWDRRVPLTAQIASNRNRVRIAEALLNAQPSSAQRELAILSKIEALSVIYGTQFLSKLDTQQAGADFREAAQEFQDDADAEIAKTARLSIVKVDSFEFVRNGSVGTFQPTNERILMLLRDYPDDEYIIASIKLIMISLLGVDRESSLDIMRNLVTHQSEFESAKTAELFGFLADEIKLTQSNIRTLFENRWVNGIPGQRELAKVAVALAADPTGGLEVLNQIDLIANWFEQVKQYETAEQIYQAMLESAEQRESVKAAVTASEYSRNGLTRCKLVGQPIEFEATLDTGEKLSSQDLQNQVCVIIFWATDDSSSFSSVVEFHNQSQSRPMRGKRVRVFAYCTNETSGKSLRSARTQLGNFKILVNAPNENGSPTLLQKCPVSSLPYAMIIDRRGNVSAVNVPLDELRTAVDFLLDD